MTAYRSMTVLSRAAASAVKLLPLRLRHAAQNVGDRLSRIGARKPAFIIIGSGRCGTNYVANYLTAAGHPCGHERFHRPTGPIYSTSETRVAHSGDSSWLAVPFLPVAGVCIVHQTREPVAVIRSFLKLGFFHPEHYARHKRFVDFARRHFEFSDDPLRSAVRWYIEWNEKCVAITDRSFRLEDFPNRLEQLSEWLGFEKALGKLDLLTHTNTKQSVVSTGEEDIRSRITEVAEYSRLVDLAGCLGYDI